MERKSHYSVIVRFLRLIPSSNDEDKTWRIIYRIDNDAIINFDHCDVVYDYADLNESTLAWATSIHKD